MDTNQILELFKNKLDKMLVSEMVKTRAPSFSIGVIKDDKLIFTRNYGAIDIDKNKPATPDSIYMIASITKSFTACGILKLMEMGKLSIDDPINNYIPIKLGMDGYPILIKHVLSHSSGIPNLTDELWTINSEDLYDIPYEIPKIPFSTWDDVFRILEESNEYVTDKPGERFYYNNMLYDVLGYIIENVSGMKFADFIKKEILEPLNMYNSGFYSEEIANNCNLATPYIIKPKSNPAKLIPTTYPERKFISAAGGLFTSVNELANYVIMHLNQGKFKNKQIIPEKLIGIMQSNQFTEKYPNEAFRSFYGNYGEIGYGFGLEISSDFLGHKLVQHSGSYMGSSTWMAMIPELKLGVICLSNHHPSPRMFAQIILMELLGKNSSEYHPLLKLRNHHKKLCGKYSIIRDIQTISVISQGGGLFIKYPDQKTIIPIFPINDEPYDLQLNYYMFTEIGGKMPVQFTINNNDIFLHIERLKFKKVDNNL